MSILDKLLVWASTGDKTEPSSAFIADGWQRVQRPSRQKWNWLTNKRDTLINALIDSIESLGTAKGDMTSTELCQGMVTLSDKWHAPGAYPNYLATGVAIKDACLGFDSTNNIPLLWVAHGDKAIAKLTGPWCYDAAPQRGAAETLDYPSTPDYVESICCDKSYLYVAWYVTAGDIQVTKFDAITLAEVWTKDTGMAIADAEGPCKLIVAGTSNLAILLPGNCDDGANSGKGIGILAKVDGAFTPGFGDNDGSVELGFSPEAGRIVSDGTHVYFMLYADNGTRQYTLHSAKISDPTTSDYVELDVADVAIAGAGSDRPTGLYATGTGVVVTACPNGMSYLADLTADDVNELVEPANFTVGGANDNIEAMIGFDGLNLWVYWVSTSAESAAGAMTLFKIPAGYCSRYYPTGASAIELELNRVVIGVGETTSEALAGEFVFDGRDIWLLTPSGDIFRLCAPGMR